MCFKNHSERYSLSPSYHAAKRLFVELEEVAKQKGYQKNIVIKNKKRIVRDGFSKADAQIIWEKGPEDWATDLALCPGFFGVDYVVENGYTVSFYDKY